MAITEQQYELLKEHLPRQRGNVKINNLDLINGILYVAENGCKWRALPSKYGRWDAVYKRMRRWADNGVLEKLFQKLQEFELIKIKIEHVCLDSTSVKVHPDGTGALKKTAHNPSGNQLEDGTQKFIWCPQLTRRR